eukprot:Platyproteum_vivax@DN4526_c0_g1_i1.p1
MTHVLLAFHKGNAVNTVASEHIATIHSHSFAYLMGLQDQNYIHPTDTFMAPKSLHYARFFHTLFVIHCFIRFLTCKQRIILLLLQHYATFPPKSTCCCCLIK